MRSLLTHSGDGDNINRTSLVVTHTVLGLSAFTCDSRSTWELIRTTAARSAVNSSWFLLLAALTGSGEVGGFKREHLSVNIAAPLRRIIRHARQACESRSAPAISPVIDQICPVSPRQPYQREPLPDGGVRGFNPTECECWWLVREVEGLNQQNKMTLISHPKAAARVSQEGKETLLLERSVCPVYAPPSPTHGEELG